MSDKAGIKIVQWREFGDDEDSLDVGFFAPGDDTDPVDQIREEHGLKPYDDVNPDRPGSLLVTNEQTIFDGETFILDDGRRFRIRIEELKPEYGVWCESEGQDGVVRGGWLQQHGTTSDRTFQTEAEAREAAEAYLAYVRRGHVTTRFTTKVVRYDTRKQEVGK
jgi:hypothetical protein